MDRKPYGFAQAALRLHDEPDRNKQVPDRRSQVGTTTAEQLTDRQSGVDRFEFGERLRTIRKSHNWTLEHLGQKSGVAFSTISKAERGLIALTYDNILKLAVALGMEMSELLAPSSSSLSGERVTLERRGEAQTIDNEYYVMKMLCSARAKKRMMPVLATIKAQSITEFSRLISHPGEEFVFVLEGELTFQIDGQPPRVLQPGDCVYFDSILGHAYLSTGNRDCKLIVVCWHPTSSEMKDVGLGERLM